jgi:hypothetical protein
LNGPPLSAFEDAIRTSHGVEGKVRAVETVRVDLGDGTVWKGLVLIFDVVHPRATLCYAWQSGSGYRMVTTILGDGGIASPEEAVVAAYRAELF